MDLTGSSLLLVADGRRARLFEERRRGGALIEVTARLGDLSHHRAVASGFRAGFTTASVAPPTPWARPRRRSAGKPTSWTRSPPEPSSFFVTAATRT